MDKNAANFDLSLNQIVELVKKLAEVFVFMVKYWINDMVYFILRLIWDLLHTSCCRND